MKWLQRFNQAINYIEENLSATISYEHAAQIACCSTYHFQRMFSYITGIPLSEYIRRRRMTVAAFDLQTHKIKIVDAALKYGYDSPTSFNRAFRSVHGVSPSIARTEGISLKAFPRISFTVSIKGDVEMNYKIEKKEAFKIVGIKEHMDIEESLTKVPLFWQKNLKSNTIDELCKLMDQHSFGVLGVSTCEDSKGFDYYIGVVTDKPAPEGTVEYEVPACTWAIFECVGPVPLAILELEKRIITEWLPTSGYEYANAPDIEVLTNGDPQSSTYRSEVWFPIKEKV